MGVQGLWHLLQPCARPTKLESLEGKRLAIDSSIWLYHFQMAMRDKEGRTLSNAHILGFLWRILKLIHFGIRPIFVFDGGAPVLKRKTLSGRRQRKTGARDDHRRVAERLLHARMREAAISHVSGRSVDDGGSSGVELGAHGLGSNVVYMDDLAGSTGASAAAEFEADEIDDGSITRHKAMEKEKDEEAARKKKRDQWHKDPYALPALERDISSLTAENSAAARKARGGGRRPDIRFATEGELRSLLSSIQPTDLDLDSDFFRSLPTELQYELVGDLRAASRGTSYKRLQSMLAASPTPIDFSRAQIAGLKTRNELTQKVLEVTDEIGDAHIKVPVRVAGARNREYVLIRNKGDQAGFVLGVRETGNTQDQAIALEEDTASATTNEDEFEKRNTDEEFELENVAVEESPQKAAMPDIPEEIRHANPNDPVARKQVARELLQRRARQLAKEKAKEQGIVDESELMEEELEKMRVALHKGPDSKGKGGMSKVLFRPNEIDLDRIGMEKSGEGDYDLQEALSQAGDEDQIDLDEAQDLAKALADSEKDSAVQTGELDEGSVELYEVDTNGVDAVDYSAFYGHQQQPFSKETEGDPAAPLSPPMPVLNSAPPTTTRVTTSRPQTPPSRDTTPTRAIKNVPGLGFRLYDREGYPERLNPKLLTKIRWEARDSKGEEELEQLSGKANSKSVRSSAISVSDSDTGDDQRSAKDIIFDVGPIVSERSEHEKQDREGNTVKVVEFEDHNAPAHGLPDHSSRLNPSSPPSKFVRSDKTVSPQKHLGPQQLKASSEAQDAISIATNSSEPAVEEDRGEENDSLREADGEQALENNSPLQPSSPLRSSRGGSPGISVRHDEQATAMDEAKITLDDGSEPDFDNLVSMAEEEGDVPDVRAEAATVQSDERQEAEPEGPVYSPDWSRSPTPADEVVLGPDGFPLPSAAELEAMDEEDEADLEHMEGDQDEFVSFLSRAKGRGLHEVRREVEDEVNKLRSEHANTRRNEGDVTQQMAKEIQLMLRLFGLPYITAPMEAEAQCAELVAIGLADGIITDDSDVFLFGGTFIYKNMFNNKKYVECYKLSDLQHDLGMDRTKLVQLAYLLGSDYTDGLEGVGPVLAMEILSNFDGDDALVKFREWWMKVQMGQDTPRDTCNTTLKRIKRTLRNKVHVNDSWPDVHVLNAYYEPTVDSSDESFQWGLPDLDSLRSFFFEYLRWDREKTDHYLIPAIEEQNRRNRRTQGTLDTTNFFDLSAGQSAYAGRARPGYNSSRLQQVITNFRASKRAADRKQARGGDAQEPVSISEDEDGASGEDESGTIPEQQLGKEMGKRSRPIVSREGAPTVGEGTQEEEREETQEHSTGKRGKGRGRGRGRGVPQRGRKTGTSGRGRKRVERDGSGSSEEAAVPHVDDEEWRPRAAKPKKRKTGPADGAPGTRLTQARSMNLDHVNSLPPSRAPGMRPRMSASTSREDVGAAAVTISEDESSALSEEE